MIGRGCCSTGRRLPQFKQASTVMTRPAFKSTARSYNIVPWHLSQIFMVPRYHAVCDETIRRKSLCVKEKDPPDRPVNEAFGPGTSTSDKMNKARETSSYYLWGSLTGRGSCHRMMLLNRGLHVSSVADTWSVGHPVFFSEESLAGVQQAIASKPRECRT